LKNKTAHEQFTKYLKREKHRITPERFEVLDFALEHDGHFGADDLYVLMKTKKSNISRATVYNTLELLVKCKLLSKRNFGDGLTRYESNFERKNHDHLICINCGEIIEFTSPEVQKVVDKICNELGFEKVGYSFNIFGKCKEGNSCKNLK
jgi:Fur family ferric uptake transcriptional regulator